MVLSKLWRWTSCGMGWVGCLWEISGIQVSSFIFDLNLARYSWTSWICPHTKICSVCHVSPRNAKKGQGGGTKIYTHPCRKLSVDTKETNLCRPDETTVKWVKVSESTIDRNCFQSLSCMMLLNHRNKSDIMSHDVCQPNMCCKWLVCPSQGEPQHFINVTNCLFKESHLLLIACFLCSEWSLVSFVKLARMQMWTYISALLFPKTNFHHTMVSIQRRSFQEIHLIPTSFALLNFSLPCIRMCVKSSVMAKTLSSYDRWESTGGEPEELFFGLIWAECWIQFSKNETFCPQARLRPTPG